MKDVVGGNETPKASEQSREQTGHTPAPWNKVPGSSTFGIVALGMPIAQTHSDDETDAANARLIAAAPELIEAAKTIVSEISDDDSLALQYGGKLGVYLTSSQIKQLRAAIAKAEGK